MNTTTNDLGGLRNRLVLHLIAQRVIGTHAVRVVGTHVRCSLYILHSVYSIPPQEFWVAHYSIQSDLLVHNQRVQYLLIHYFDWMSAVRDNAQSVLYFAFVISNIFALKSIRPYYWNMSIFFIFYCNTKIINANIFENLKNSYLIMYLAVWIQYIQ